MTESQRETLFEAYHGAAYQLVTGRGGLRDRVREALTEFQRCEALRGVMPTDVFEGKVLDALPRFLEAVDRVDTMPEVDLAEIAWDICQVQREVEAAFARRAAEEQEEILPTPDRVL